jgi:hypothetical protein
MSLSLDLSNMLTIAGEFVNSLFPAFLVPLALSFAVSVLTLIISVIFVVFSKMRFGGG